MGGSRADPKAIAGHRGHLVKAEFTSGWSGFTSLALYIPRRSQQYLGQKNDVILRVEGYSSHVFLSGVLKELISELLCVLCVLKDCRIAGSFPHLAPWGASCGRLGASAAE